MLYTYTAGRVAPLVLMAFTAYVGIWHRTALAATIRGLALTCLIATLVFVPQALHFAQRPELFTMRAEAVSVLNPDVNKGNVPSTLLTSSLRTAGVFGFAGDGSWERNVSGRPVFDPASSILFVLGIVICLRHWREPAKAFILLWFATMLLPCILAPVDAPNYLRLIGVIPAVFALPAIGFSWLTDLRIAARPRRWHHLLPSVIAIAGFVAICVSTGVTYFGRWAHAPQVIDTFGSDRWLAIQDAVARSHHELVYLGSGERDDLPAHFVFGDAPPVHIRMFDGSQSLILPGSGESATYVFPASRSPGRGLLQRVFPDGPVATRSSGGAIVSAYRLSDSRQPLVPEVSLDMRFGDSLHLIGCDFSRTVYSGEESSVTWYWETLEQHDRDLVFFHHLLDVEGRRVGQRDSRVLPARYWESGTRGLSFFSVVADPNAPSGAYWLSVGVYDRATLQRLPVFDSQGRPIGDQVRLGPLKVHGRSPQPPPIQHELQGVLFADSIGLRGYDISWSESDGKAMADLTLYWEAYARPSRDYTMFVHLLDRRKQMLAQADSPPMGGGYPTSLWDDGDVVIDQRRLLLDRMTEASDLAMLIGLYEPETGKRLPVVSPSGSIIGDSVPIPIAR